MYQPTMRLRDGIRRAKGKEKERHTMATMRCPQQLDFQGSAAAVPEGQEGNRRKGKKKRAKRTQSRKEPRSLSRNAHRTRRGNRLQSEAHCESGRRNRRSLSVFEGLVHRVDGMSSRKPGGCMTQKKDGRGSIKEPKRKTRGGCLRLGAACEGSRLANHVQHQNFCVLKKRDWLKRKT